MNAHEQRATFADRSVRDVDVAIDGCQNIPDPHMNRGADMLTTNHFTSEPRGRMSRLSERGFLMLLFFVLIAPHAVAQTNISNDVRPLTSTLNMVVWQDGVRKVIDVPKDVEFDQKTRGRVIQSMLLNRSGEIRMVVVGDSIIDRFDDAPWNKSITTKPFDLPGKNTEVLTIPIPGRPSQYVVMGNAATWRPWGGGNSLAGKIPYVRVDADMGSIKAPEALLLPLRRADMCGDVTFVASNPINADTSYVFVRVCNRVYRYVLTSTGFQYGPGAEIPLQSPQDVDNSYRLISEVELHDGWENGRRALRLATLECRGQGNFRSIRAVVVDVMSRDILMSIDVVSCDAESGHTAAAGMEFSPSGRYLYIMTMHGLRRFDVDSGGFERPIKNVDRTNPFTACQIELGSNGQLYFAANGTAMAINYPDTDPTVDFAAPGGTYFLASEFIDNVYAMPNQIDRIYPEGPAGVDPRSPAFMNAGAFPNPTHGAFRLSYRLEQPAVGGLLRVRNAVGESVLERPLDRHLEEGEHSIAVDLSDRPSGVYWVSIEAGGVRTTMPVQVVR